MTTGQLLTAVQISRGEGPGKQRGKVKALNVARPRQRQEQVKARSRVTDGRSTPINLADSQNDAWLCGLVRGVRNPMRNVSVPQKNFLSPK